VTLLICSPVAGAGTVNRTYAILVWLRTRSGFVVPKFVPGLDESTYASAPVVTVVTVAEAGAGASAVADVAIEASAAKTSVALRTVATPPIRR
jgi:hypothetical protein